MDLNRKPTVQKSFTDKSLNIDFKSAMPQVKECMENYVKQTPVKTDKASNTKSKEGHRLANF
jgi:hypothetical protein